MKNLSTSKHMIMIAVSAVLASTPFLAVADRYDMGERCKPSAQIDEQYIRGSEIPEGYKLHPTPFKANDLVGD